MKKAIILVLMLLSLYSLTACVNSNFGDVMVGSKQSRFFEVTNTGSEIAEVSIVLDSSAFTVAGEMNYTLGIGESKEHYVLFSPTEAITYKTLLKINTTIPGYENKIIDLSGTGVHNNPPEAKNVVIKGLLSCNIDIKVDYEFYDPDGHDEDWPSFQWYQSADQVNWTEVFFIVRGKSTFMLFDVPTGNYLKLSIIPVDQYAMLGEEVLVFPSTPVMDLEPPTNLVYTLKDSSDVVLTWEAPVLSETPTFLGYEIFREDISIATITDYSTLTYIDSNVSDGKYLYSIKSNFSPATLSKSSNIVDVTIATKKDEQEIVNGKDNSFDYTRYPNPFSPGALFIPFFTAEDARLKVHVCNLQEELVRVLANNKFGPGSYKLPWDGKDDQGNDVRSGVYFYKVIYPEGDSKTSKMILMK